MTDHPPAGGGRAAPIDRLGRLAVLAVLLAAAAGCALPRWQPPYGEGRPPVRDLDLARKRLAGADAASHRLFLGEIGRTAAGDGEGLPLWRLAYRPFAPGLPRVLIVAGARGDEPAGPEAALALAEAWARAPEAGPPADVDVVPMLNPWGWVYDLPLARSGIDLDADFSAFDAGEARVLRRFLREKRYDLVIELREDRQARGFSLWLTGGGDREAARRVADAIRAAGMPLEDAGAGLLLSARDGVVAVPRWKPSALDLARRLDLAGYLNRTLGAPVFSARAPAALPLAERTAALGRAVEGLVTEFAARR
jgi:hypothetical protein